MFPRQVRLARRMPAACAVNAAYAPPTDSRGLATLAGALAISHNIAPRLAAAMVGYGLLLSLLTLPLWAQLPIG